VGIYHRQQHIVIDIEFKCGYKKAGFRK
jgi:hypothetical protein